MFLVIFNSYFIFCFFFFIDTATTEIYTFPYTTLFRSVPRGLCTFELWAAAASVAHSGTAGQRDAQSCGGCGLAPGRTDRKSTRLNSSHQIISYAVFCLKKKKTTTTCDNTNSRL